MKILFVSLLSCAVLLGMTNSALSRENANGGAGNIHLSMAALKAAETAMNQFLSEQPNVDVKTFYVVIEESVDSFQVDFVPNPIPVKEGYDGDKPYIEMQSGGGNEYGRNIRYVVSMDGKTILKTIYPR